MNPPEAPLRLDLDGDALAANWRWLHDRSGGAACGAAIKADGYGLGARAVLDRLAAVGCRDFFVATWGEAAALGALPDGVALSVLHGVRAEDIGAALGGPARPVLNSAAQVARWREAGGGACDVMIDTGMNRLGLTPGEACSGLLDGLGIATLMSHLACADEPEDPMNERQLAAFRSLRVAIPAERYSLANSAGICLAPEYAFDLTRPGLALYGGSPMAGDGARHAVPRQVVRPMAQLLQVRDLLPGETVGYGATWMARAPSRIGILNVGYADGFSRAAGRDCVARVGDDLFEVVGRVSMDLLAIRIGEALREGDWLELPFDLPVMAAHSGLSQYELLTGLGRRYQRRWR